jgi:protoheme IX farnesyltransferase
VHGAVDQPNATPEASLVDNDGVIDLRDARAGSVFRGVSVSQRANGVPEMRAQSPRSRTKSVARAYVALTKPRIIEQLLITTLPAMVLADQGWPSPGLVAATIVGGSFAAGAANTINMVIDRDIDQLMDRTKGRPLVTGEIKPASALIFAVTLQMLSLVVLTAAANLLSALLALGATLFYVGVYTMALKRRTPQNIVIGGAAGAVPALVGWAAVTNSLSATAWMLFVLVCVWTPPHFWALALRYRDDYAAAHVPMLPVIKGIRATTQQMIAYAIVVAGVAVGLIWVAETGWIYAATALVTSIFWLVLTVAVHRNPEPKVAMRLFAYSISYLTALSLALVVDELVL